MKDILKDLITHTFGIGGIEVVKVVGTDTETSVEAVGAGNTVIVNAQLKEARAELKGTFGMPKMDRLLRILNIPEYESEAELSTTTDPSGALNGLVVKNKGGDFYNDYRFMSEAVISDQLLSAKLRREPAWDVDIEPHLASIQRLKFQSGALSEETTFYAKAEGGKLVFYFGDPSSASGNFVFQTGIAGTLDKPWNYSVPVVNSILALSGTKKLRFSNGGIMQIIVDSGTAVYTYSMPALTK
jgi:hypothetical protein